MGDGFGSNVTGRQGSANGTRRVSTLGNPGDAGLRWVDVLGPGGGYMLSSVHTMMNDVPLRISWQW